MTRAKRPRRAKRRSRASDGFDPLIHSNSPEVEAGIAQLDFPAISVLMSKKLGKPVTADQCRAIHSHAIRKFRREWLSRETEHRSCA